MDGRGDGAINRSWGGLMWPWVDDDWMARGMAQWINKSIMDGRRADSVFGLGLDVSKG